MFILGLWFTKDTQEKGGKFLTRMFGLCHSFGEALREECPCLGHSSVVKNNEEAANAKFD